MLVQMKNLHEQLANCQFPAEQAFSIPPECYTSEELFQEEFEKIFQRNWIGLGRADRFAVAGDYETMNLGLKPIILLRDHDGVLGFCQHLPTPRCSPFERFW